MRLISRHTLPPSPAPQPALPNHHYNPQIFHHSFSDQLPLRVGEMTKYMVLSRCRAIYQWVEISVCAVGDGDDLMTLTRDQSFYLMAASLLRLYVESGRTKNTSI